VSKDKGYFEVVCCGRRRGLLPGKVLLCSKCDYNHDGATVVPNENQVKDVPADVWFYYHDGRDNA
jgi:hypothetical protein